MPKNRFFNFLQFQVFTEYLEHPEYPPLYTARYDTFCRPSLTGRFGLFQNANKPDYVLLVHGSNSSFNGTSD